MTVVLLGILGLAGTWGLWILKNVPDPSIPIVTPWLAHRALYVSGWRGQLWWHVWRLSRDKW